MIVPMKKVSILAQPKDAASLVEQLRGLSVVHVEHQKAPAGKDVDTIRDDIALIEKAMAILSADEFLKASCKEATDKIVDWRFSAKHIIDSWKRLDQVSEYARGLKSEISKWRKWGDFEPSAIQALAERGIFVSLYQIPTRDIKLLPGDVVVKELFASKGMVSCAVISDRRLDIPFNEITPPKASISKLEARLQESNRTIEWIKEDIRRHLCYREEFARIKGYLQKELEFNEVLSGMGDAGTVVYLNGFIPYDAVDTLLAVSKREKWAIVIEDPSEDERVPTLVRNPRWISIISPVFKMLEILPGYRELDMSFWFLIFFSVFFGMLIGDAGYGMLFFASTLFAHRRFGKGIKNKSIFILFYLLSFCAIGWGVLSGTFFGQGWLPSSVKPLIPALRDDKNIQVLCFFLGALHLSIAHLWRTVLKLPSLKALAEVGWTLILWGAYFLAKMLIVGDAFPQSGKWLFIGGAVLVILFTNPTKNVFRGVGAGFGNFILNVINSFTDVVSYIRLFAVGLATVAIADAFNNIALGIGYGSVLTGAVTSLILIVGHALNITLGFLAIIVHGVRLNVLEFSNHLEIKWSGFSYKPLQK